MGKFNPAKVKNIFKFADATLRNYHLKKHFRYILFILPVLFQGINLSGQDVHFSQFYHAPLALNPANTGNFNGEWRVMNLYRNQWTAIPYPYRTLSVGADKLFYYFKDIVSAGIYVVSDKSGAVNLQVNKIYVSGAYKKYLYNYSLSGGLQVGYVNKQVSFNNLTFPEQFDMTTGDFNLQLNNNEINSQDRASYIDVNAGFIGSTVYHKIKLESGIALYHINYPEESFTGSGARLPVRYVFHGKAGIPVREIFFARPQFLYMFHKKASNLLFGSDFGVKVPYNTYKLNSVFAGCYLRGGFSRKTDAVVLACGVEWYRLTLGLSYDFNFSFIKPAVNNRGSFEISLIYTSFNAVPPKITIPCDMY